MLNAMPKPLRSLSTNQLVTLGVLVLLVLFLIVGSLLGDNSSTAGTASQPFLILALLAFGGGLFSFLSPCTLPILPAYFAFAFQSGRKQIAANTIAFMLGVATMFSLLGGTASTIGRLLIDFQNLLLLIGGSLVLLFGVMSLLGKGFSGFKEQESGGMQNSSSFGGSYLFGLTFSVGWSSCVGPILGVVLTMATQTHSVLRGMLLLFIYALGLGLPLIFVSTLFGRTSRKSLFWRLLRGRGWQVVVPILAVALLWGLAVWRILVAVGDYLLTVRDPLNVVGLPAWQVWGLLIVALVGVSLWMVARSAEKETPLNLHSTQLVSGALFIFMGILMLNGSLATFNQFVPVELATWFEGLERGFQESFETRFVVELPDTPSGLADGGSVTLTLPVEGKRGLFKADGWTEPVTFSVKERNIGEGVTVQFLNGDSASSAIIMPPGQLTINVAVLSSIEDGKRLFMLEGQGGDMWRFYDFRWGCNDDGSCRITMMDL